MMQNVPLDAVLHFDLHASILGWLLTAVQPKLQPLRHNIDGKSNEQRQWVGLRPDIIIQQWVSHSPVL
jgi:hypothetical protein